MWSFIHSVLSSKEEEESEPFHQNVFMLRLPWQRSEEPHLSFQRAKPQVVGFLLRTEADNLTCRLRSEAQTDSLTPLFYLMNKHLTENHLERCPSVSIAMLHRTRWRTSSRRDEGLKDHMFCLSSLCRATRCWAAVQDVVSCTLVSTTWAELHDDICPLYTHIHATWYSAVILLLLFAHGIDLSL